MSQVTVAATGVRDTAEKSALGPAVGVSKTRPLWLEFCRSLARLGLSPVQLTISDARAGLHGALARAFTNASWLHLKGAFPGIAASAVPNCVSRGPGRSEIPSSSSDTRHRRGRGAPLLAVLGLNFQRSPPSCRPPERGLTHVPGQSISTARRKPSPLAGYVAMTVWS